MTDLERTKLCAEAMGYRMDGAKEFGFSWLMKHAGEDGKKYWNPLHDDAQAMALVKRFGLMLDTMANRELGWCVCPPSGDEEETVISTDLNRAIVGCVAKMQVDRTAQETLTVATKT